jgi:hypothetical protein
MARYDGEWANGRHHGVGLMLWPNGQKYDGEWQEGLMHGAGVHRWQNGTCRSGVWSKGERQKWTTPESFGLSGPHAAKMAKMSRQKDKGGGKVGGTGKAGAPTVAARSTTPGKKAAPKAIEAKPNQSSAKRK